MPSFSPLVSALALLACVGAVAQTPAAGPYFNRVATFEAHRNVPAGRNVSKKSVAEIVAVSADGMTLAYTDGEQMGIGLIDIRNPAQPKPAGFLPVEGEPTSVTMPKEPSLPMKTCCRSGPAAVAGALPSVKSARGVATFSLVIVASARP